MVSDNTKLLKIFRNQGPMNQAHNERQQICHYNIYIKGKYPIEEFPLFGTYLKLAAIIIFILNVNIPSRDYNIYVKCKWISFIWHIFDFGCQLWCDCLIQRALIHVCLFFWLND